MAIVDVIMPKMGESITEGTVLVWRKRPGEHVERDETLLEIGTDKVDSEVPSPAAGVLREILVPEGQTVPVGTVIARIETEVPVAEAPAAPEPAGQQAPLPQEEVSAAATASAPADRGSDGQPASKGTPPRRIGPSGRFYSPLVRSIARAEGISLEELETISGSGSGGRVTKRDLLAYLERRKAEPAVVAEAAPALAPQPIPEPAPSPYSGRVEIIEMDRMRRLIAEHMVRSKQTSPHVTSFAEADVTRLVQWRERHKEAFERREGFRLTYTPLFVEALVEALKEFPYLNASVDGTRILLKRDIHIGVAVAIGQTGLIVPVIKHADSLSLLGLARAVQDLATRARNKQLKPEELEGGTFTLTNVGSLGSLMGTPIINQPQVAILATGQIKKRPVVVETEYGDVIAIRHMMYLSLSYDHRIIDGAMGAAFLSRLVQILESFDVNRQI
ncbi:MAG: 2-oxo acid dehydrogenase subunit E2 [Bacteroidetes bacterium]|nr:2-oxo acid dehydrogenase subunit E2 [Rhodothermia bacterium]MCX7906621.1 2-oxo acid dehydrogenase subunit E2 [Bacteroidota bacterium]MDW8285031.1 dihydrolipoamide acetyltransferase family protein [Bacteroidota bacterium]